MKIYYNRHLKKLSRKLRNEGTLAEVLLWNEIKKRKLFGYQFMRQKPIGNYIVDFYCSKLKLAIEIDGESHSEKLENDIMRQRKLESLGITVLRFEDIAVKKDLSGVMDIMKCWISKNNPLPPFIKGD